MSRMLATPKCASMAPVAVVQRVETSAPPVAALVRYARYASASVVSGEMTTLEIAAPSA
jgi:hypothetical protein